MSNASLRPGSDATTGNVRVPCRYFNADEAATYLRVSKPFLAKLRRQGDGPQFSKLGDRVSYSIADLDAWRANRLRTSTADKGLTRGLIDRRVTKGTP